MDNFWFIDVRVFAEGFLGAFLFLIVVQTCPPFIDLLFIVAVYHLFVKGLLLTCEFYFIGFGLSYFISLFV